ncbi:hypothetical protein AHF37_10835, partial [Paragonimus kellicotti]
QKGGTVLCLLFAAPVNFAKYRGIALTLTSEATIMLPKTMPHGINP